MTTAGTLTETKTGFIGHIADLAFDADIELVPNPRKSKDEHPEFVIYGKSPRGRRVEIGAAWSRVSQNDNEYLSMSLSIMGNQVRVNALPDGDKEGQLFLRPFANPE